VIPGEYIIGVGEIELNADRVPVTVRVENTGDRPIQVGSHTHFFEVNSALRFDRDAAYGRRLDIAAGTSLRFEPGEAREVTLIPLAGLRVARGMRGLVNGPLEPQQ
jgi:urease subunit beta